MMYDQIGIHQLLDVVPHVNMIRHSPGRMELQITLSGLSKLNGMDLKAFGQSIPGILNIKPKLLSRSVIVFYDPDILPPGLFERLVQLKEKPEPDSPIFAELSGALGGRNGSG
jgi:hypothetical protein